MFLLPSGREGQAPVLRARSFQDRRFTSPSREEPVRASRSRPSSFMPGISTCVEALKDYLLFQLCLKERPFQGYSRIAAGPQARRPERSARSSLIYYDLDFNHREVLPGKASGTLRRLRSGHLGATSPWAPIQQRRRLRESWPGLRRPVQEATGPFGRFALGPLYDESPMPRCRQVRHGLHQIDMTSGRFADSIRKVIYHLDYPVAGGLLPQYRLEARLPSPQGGPRGQGSDEIFGATSAI